MVEPEAAQVEEPIPRLPSSALRIALLGFLGGFFLSAVLGGIAYGITQRETSSLVLLFGFIGFWTPLVVAARYASKRLGSGSMAADLGWSFRSSDLGWGVLVALAGVAASFLVGLVLSPFPDLVGTNTGFIEAQKGNTLGLWAVAAASVIGAPVVEELFFRGLVQRALNAVMAVVAAALVQAAIFGLIHSDPGLGAKNVSVVLGVGAFGVVLGFAGIKFGRLGPLVLGHALFNALAVIPLVT